MICIKIEGGRIAEGLSANDRVKARLSVLQAAELASWAARSQTIS
jgi:hypothetical protein